MEEPTTCGRGLAASAPLPEALAAVAASMAAVLDTHRAMLRRTDEAARQEDDAYQVLVEQLRSGADQLRATSARMAACRDLPMGAHDMDSLSASRAADAFAEFVRSERSLADLLQGRVEDDETMLTEMAEAGE